MYGRAFEKGWAVHLDFHWRGPGRRPRTLGLGRWSRRKSGSWPSIRSTPRPRSAAQTWTTGPSWAGS